MPLALHRFLRSRRMRPEPAPLHDSPIRDPADNHSKKISWYNLLIARFALGFAVGAKSSTTPVYAAESAPKVIRGALTMMWQVCLSRLPILPFKRG